MTLRFLEGFEVESFLTHATRKYATVTNGWGTSIAGRMNSAHRAIRDFDMTLITDALVGAVANTWTIGFGYRISGGSSAPASVTRAPGIRLLDGVSATTDEQIAIEMQPEVVLASEDGRAQIVVRRGATILGTSTVRLLDNRWYYIEFQVVVRTGVNGSFIVKVHDFYANTVTTVLNVSGVNTANQASDGADRVAIVWDSVGTAADLVDFDDIYVSDDSTFLGNTLIEGMETSAGNGDTAQWTLQGGATSVGNALLDQQTQSQALYEDNRIVSDVTGQISLAPYADLTWIKDGTIHGVILNTLARMESSGTRTLKPVFRHKNTGSPSNFEGTSFIVSDTNFDTFLEVFQTNPVTTVAWLVADLNLGQFGVKLHA